jgi:hypothetical protein
MQTPRYGVREVARYVWIEFGGRPAHVSCVPEFGLKTHRPELLEAAANLAATIESPPPPSLRPSRAWPRFVLSLSTVSCQHKSHTNGAGMSICVANDQESYELSGMIEN